MHNTSCYIYFNFCTCFGQLCAHHQENSLYLLYTGIFHCVWVDNIRMDLQEVGCGYMDWIGLAQDRDRWRTLVSAVMNLRVS